MSRRSRRSGSGNPLAMESRHGLIACRRRAEQEIAAARALADRTAEAEAQAWLNAIWAEIRRRDLAKAPAIATQTPDEPDEPTALGLAFAAASADRKVLD